MSTKIPPQAAKFNFDIAAGNNRVIKFQVLISPLSNTELKRIQEDSDRIVASIYKCIELLMDYNYAPCNKFEVKAV